MFSSKRSSGRQGSKRSVKKRQNRQRPGLSVDTNFTRHIAPAPQEVVPYTQHSRNNAYPINDDYERSAKTPVIVITPAREDFDLQQSPGHSRQHRAPSSVYSRYTDFLPKSGRLSKAPPVPALPFLTPNLASRKGRGPFSVRVEKPDPRLAHVASVCTVFEEDASPLTITSGVRPVHRSASGALPTPRRSNGWWNLITSPFSAQSSVFTWRSPKDDEKTPILIDGQRRLSEDSSDELHSAPPAYKCRGVGENAVPHRSMTAPSVLSTSADGVDIYHIPSQGEAAAYYDPSKHFPSLMVSPSQARSIFEDDTPISIVTPHDPAIGKTAAVLLAMPTMPADPFGDEHAATQQSKPTFSTPAAAELQTPVPMPFMPAHSPTTNASQFSPLSPSPVLGQAHITQVIGEVKGEQKKVDVAAPRGQSSPAIHGLGFATMASRSEDEEKSSQARSFGHSRTSSYGLGISGSQAGLFPAARELDEKEAQLATTGVPWYRRFFWPLVALLTALLTLMVVLLVMHIPQKHSDISIQAQWANLTGFPALPVGVTTVVQPKNVRNDSGCVSPAALWSCAISADKQRNSTVLPDFRFEIRFRNDSSLNSSLVQTNPVKRSGNSAVLASSIMQRVKLVARDAWSSSLFVANPAVPTDQVFLGNTTDNNTMPYDGEATPFYISLVDSEALLPALRKRQSFVYPYPTADNSTSTNASSTAPPSIPRPALEDDGTPRPETLYPLPQAQPLRLYKRHQQDEHYGFYTYFDRTVYVANSSAGTVLSNAPLSNASAVCTWSQSRFLVQIWTRGLVRNNSLSDSTSSSDVAASNSTANDMAFPGSFPYAVTITLDRHGGDASRKGVYCYGIGADHHVEQNVKAWIAEDRAHGGALVNAASVPTNRDLSRRDDSTGGVDGGTGGCACAWQNW